VTIYLNFLLIHYIVATIRKQLLISDYLLQFVLVLKRVLIEL